MSYLEDKDKVDRAVEKLIDNEVEYRVKEYPVYVQVNGRIVDAEIEYADGQINVKIQEPIFFAESGKTGFVTMEMPRRMAM